jgi:tRNA uridine 5-carbamoylmethylation protein Kti12
MVDLFKNDSTSETNKMTSIQNEQSMPQEPKTPEIPEQDPQVEDLPNSPNALDLPASFQKVRTEEQELLEIKQALLKKEQDLQRRLVEEIDKKKIAIDKLKAEITDLQNRCRQLGQSLGVDIYS